MIRSWIALTALVCSSGLLLAEDLPAPKVVPPPPAPMLPALDMPLPNIGEPAKPADTKPTEQPKVVAPSTLIPEAQTPNATAPNVTTPNVTAPNFPAPSTTVPNTTFPAPSTMVPNTAFPAPSNIVPVNPNPSGTTPALPETAVVPANTPNNNVPNELKWRYKWHNGQWWYWSPDERWMIWDRNSWSIYDPATYKAPAGFAKPGPRVVIQRSTPALPENYSGVEVSTPESTYIQPTPYAFGADSYYGINGPASSYYNRGSATGLTYGGSAYVPVYQGYLAPQYFTPRYVNPIYSYPGYPAPGYYGGRGVTIGFGF